MLRKNADGSIFVGVLNEEKPEQEKTPVEAVEAEKPQTKRKPRKSE